MIQRTWQLLNKCQNNIINQLIIQCIQIYIYMINIYEIAWLERTYVQKKSTTNMKTLDIMMLLNGY